MDFLKIYLGFLAMLLELHNIKFKLLADGVKVTCQKEIIALFNCCIAKYPGFDMCLGTKMATVYFS